VGGCAGVGSAVGCEIVVGGVGVGVALLLLSLDLGLKHVFYVTTLVLFFCNLNYVSMNLMIMSGFVLGYVSGSATRVSSYEHRQIINVQSLSFVRHQWFPTSHI